LNIFGNDGFRCEFGKHFMTKDFIDKFSNSLCDVLDKDKSILIARDTRASGIEIENWIKKIMIEKGFNLHLAQVLPTPGISNLLEEGDYSLGIMITASHNPNTDNGIKLFGGNGYKLLSNIEQDIERKILKNKFHSSDAPNGEIKFLDNSFGQYINSVVDKEINLKQRILVDCSNGAFSELSNFYRNKNIEYINNSPNGNNINLDCGALHPEKLLNEMIIKDFDFGVAFDGDGDRSVFVSKEYGVIESEKLAVLLCEDSDQDNNKVVSSEISNFALKKNLDSINGTLIETPVGDRFVVESSKKMGALFGFEPSGHFYFPDKSKSMDGFIALLKFIDLVSKYGVGINKKIKKLAHFDRVQENIDIKNFQDKDISHLQKKLNSLITKDEKLIIRKSMWDPVIRVYYDYIKENNFLNIKNEIHNFLGA
tara:strand:+ start:252 stop:1526 length:1275 start_codon:yes stop_codon:yes gene_type:complete